MNQQKLVGWLTWINLALTSSMLKHTDKWRTSEKEAADSALAMWLPLNCLYNPCCQGSPVQRSWDGCCGNTGKVMFYRFSCFKKKILLGQFLSEVERIKACGYCEQQIWRAVLMMCLIPKIICFWQKRMLPVASVCGSCSLLMKQQNWWSLFLQNLNHFKH